MEAKRPGREADHSPSSSADVKNAWSYTPIPQYAFMAWCSLKAQGQLYLYIYIYKVVVTDKKPNEGIRTQLHVTDVKQNGGNTCRDWNMSNAKKKKSF
jgi:hypothetical protein